MNTLLYKPAHSICEECCCGSTSLPMLPAQIIQTAHYLRSNGLSVSLCDAQVMAPPDFSTFDVVVVWVSVLDRLFEEMEVVSRAKATGAYTVIIPNDPMNLEEMILSRFPTVDFIIRLYDRERTLEKLLRALEASPHAPVLSFPGLVFRWDGERVDTGVQPAERGNLHHLTAADSLLVSLPLHRYEQFYVLTGKGCPHGCAFCQYRRTPPRKRAVEDVIAEIAAVQSAGARHINLLDLNFTAHTEWFLKMCALLQQRKGSTTFSIDCRLEDLLDRQRCQTMADAGIASVLVGIESLSPQTLTAIDKTIPVEQLRRGVHNAVAAHILPNLSFLVGFPQDTPADIARIHTFVHASPAILFDVNFVIPQYHSPLFETYARAGLVEGETLEHFRMGLRRPLVRSSDMNTAELIEARQSLLALRRRLSYRLKMFVFRLRARLHRLSVRNR